MGVKLTKTELTIVQRALAAYKEVKAKEKSLKKNHDRADDYERLMVVIDDTIEVFDGDIHSVYVNHTYQQTQTQTQSEGK